jgi:hypothetical protein
MNGICKALVKYVKTLCRLWESSEVIANHSSFKSKRQISHPVYVKFLRISFV